MAEALGEWAGHGLLNVAGSCCGSTPAHVAAIAAAVAGLPPRQIPEPTGTTRLSGLEPLVIPPPGNAFVNVGERTNVTGSRKFARLVADGAEDEAVDIAREQVTNGAQLIDVNMDEAMLDGVAAMTRFLRRIAAEPDIATVPVMVDSSKWSVIEAGLQQLQGKGVVNSISLKEGEEEFLRQARLCRRYGAAVVVMAFDEQGQAESVERRVAVLRRAYDLLTGVGRVQARGHHPRRQHLRDRDRDGGAQRLRRLVHRGGPAAEGGVPRDADLGRRVERLVRVPRQRPGPRGDPLGLPLPRHRGRPRHGDRQRRRPADLRRHRAGAPRAGRGRRPQPPARRHGTAARPGRAVRRRAPGWSAPRRTWPGASDRSTSA